MMTTSNEHNNAPAVPQGVPEINYPALIEAAFAKNRRWTQGTTGCIAFARGAEWLRDQMLAATPAAPLQPETLTELLRQGFAVLMAKAYSEEWFDDLSSIDGLYEFLVAEGERIPDDTTIGGTIEAIIAALRAKGGK